MLKPSEFRTYAQCIEDGRDVILAARPIIDIIAAHALFSGYSPAERDVLQRGALVNFAYLTGHGIISTDEYITLFQECVVCEDFYKLGILFSQSSIQVANSRIANNPRLPEMGNVIAPGKKNLQAGIDWDSAFLGVIEEDHANGKKIRLEDIGAPGFDELPDWALVCENCTMDQVYKKLDPSYPDVVRRNKISGMADATFGRVQNTLYKDATASF